MTTDLTGDFGLGEDEFDWDVFLPDPDESEIAAEAAALEDDAELDLDDSDFDWEAALREEGESENEGDNGARAGAAYDRIVDMVRRSFEDEPDAETDADGDAEPQPVAVQESETLLPAEREGEVESVPTGLDDAAEPDVTPHRVSQMRQDEELAPDGALAAHEEFVADDEHEPEHAPAWGSALPFVAEPDLQSGPETEPEPEPLRDLEPAMLSVADPDLDQGLDPDPGLDPQQGLDPEQGLESDPEPDVDAEPKLAPFSTLAEPAAAAALVWGVESTPDTPADLQPTWATASAAHGTDAGDLEVADVVDAVEVVGVVEAADAVDADGDELGTQATGAAKQRSRVLTATIVLACLFVVVVAAVLGVRALRPSSHPATTSAPPVTAAPPARTVTTVPSSQNVARIQTATDAVDSATTAASVGITSMTTIPTPTSVETVMNPYIAALQLYQTVLSGSQVPAAARPAEVSAQAQLRQDLVFLDTINGLPPAQLGAYLAQFDSDATSLQTTLSTLEQNLRAPAS